MRDLDIEIEKKELLGAIEAILFVSSSPVAVKRIADVLDISQGDAKKLLKCVDEGFQKHEGLKIQYIGNKVQLITNPELSKIIDDFMGIEVTTSLTQASLEALAIVAYQQPVTRPEIDEIRGVNSDGVVRNLLSKGLIEEVGRKEGLGRPILYGTTPDFLNYFGLSSLAEMPAFDVLPAEELKEKGILKD